MYRTGSLCGRMEVTWLGRQPHQAGLPVGALGRPQVPWPLLRIMSRPSLRYMRTCMQAPGRASVRACLLALCPSETSRLQKQAEGLAGPAEQPPQLPEPLTIKVTVWQGGCHLLPQAFQGNHLGAEEKKKARSEGAQNSICYKGGGRAFTLKTGQGQRKVPCVAAAGPNPGAAGRRPRCTQ